MDKNKILDNYEKVDPSKYSKLSIKALIYSLVIILVLFLLMFIGSNGKFFQFLGIFGMLSFVVSNIAGIIFWILSVSKKEPDTLSKILGGIGNVLLFLVLMGMMSFIIMDLITAGQYG